MEKRNNASIDIPANGDEFRQLVQAIVQEELSYQHTLQEKGASATQYSLAGFVQKPMYSMREVRKLFDNVSRSTIYAWIKGGKLQRKKLKGKIYFLWEDIERVLKEYKDDGKQGSG